MAAFILSDMAGTALTAALSLAALAALWYIGLRLNAYIFRGRRHGGGQWQQREHALRKERALRRKELEELRKKYACLNRQPADTGGNADTDKQNT